MKRFTELHDDDGFSDISDVEILKEILRVLYNGARDDLADTLITKFGSVVEIFNAKYEELLHVPGITPRVATFFVFLKPCFREAFLREYKSIPLTSEVDVLRYALIYFMQTDFPGDYCFFLDDNFKLLRVHRLVEEDYIRDVIGNAIWRNAKKVVFVRFNGFVSPYMLPEKLYRIYRTVNIFDLVGLEAVDYIVYQPFVFTSLRRIANNEHYKFCNLTDACKNPYTTVDFIELLKTFFTTQKNNFKNLSARVLDEMEQNKNKTRR